jgi:hypothetical protein
MADQPDERRRVAEELALLTVLADRVKAEANQRRELIATTWAGGDRVSLELPNPGNPSRPIKVGTIRADGGQGVGRVSDREAWEAWCRANYPHNVTYQPAGRTAWALDEPSRDAIALAVRAHEQANGFGVDRTREFLDVLEARGYTLTKRADVPERTVVQPSWEKAVLEQTQTAGAPCTPDGTVPEGIEFVPPSKVVKPVVTIGPDDDTRTAFVTANRHRLPELTGSITEMEQ